MKMSKDLVVGEFEVPNPFTASEQQAIDELKELCSQHTEIHFQMDNYFFTKFLRYSNWNAQNAFDAILHFYTLKYNHATLYASKNVSEYLDILKLNSRVLLGKRDKFGRIVFVAKLGNMSPTMQFNNAAIMDDLWAEALLSYPENQIHGMSIIADCKGLNSSIFKWLNPKNCKVGASKLESFPIKDWTIHLVNMGSIIKTCIMLVKPFLRKTTVARFQFHNNGFDDLVEQLGADCLPDEYGGNFGTIDYEKSLEFLVAHEKLLERNRQFGYKKQ